MLLLSACSTNVAVQGSFPPALVKKQPVTVALVMDQTFSTYQFTSEDDQRQPVVMSLGASQVQLFSRVFSDMSESTALLNAIPSVGSNNDLVVVPEIIQVQLSTPMETELKVYEVWLKYQIRVYDAQGKRITEWPLSAYGKTGSRFLKSDSEALNQATISALRDTGARLVKSFYQLPDIRQWQRTQAPVSHNTSEPTDDQ